MEIFLIILKALFLITFFVAILWSMSKAKYIAERVISGDRTIAFCCSFVLIAMAGIAFAIKRSGYSGNLSSEFYSGPALYVGSGAFLLLGIMIVLYTLSFTATQRGDGD